MPSPLFKAALFCLCGVVALPACATQTDRSARVDSLLAQWVDADGPGAAVAVLRAGEVVHMNGYGLANLEYGLPVTPATVFNVGSIAKQFTAYAVAMLAADGRLDPEDDIRLYLPEMPDYGETITIRHLLDHTSGIRDYYDLMSLAGLRLDDVVTKDQVLRLIARQRGLNFPPGEKWLYCNSGYTLLAEIVARVTGQSFPDWMHENVFSPLGMTATRFPETHTELYPNRAYSYNWSEEGYLLETLSSSDLGCTALWTTAEDLLKWMRNLEEFTLGGELVEELIGQRGVLNTGERTDYAFGHFHREHKGLSAISHSGRTAAYMSYVIRFPEQRLAVLCLGNASYLRPVMLGEAIAEIYLEEQFPEASPGSETAATEKELIPDEADGAELKPLQLDPALLARYAGEYQLEPSGKLLRVSVEDDGLLLHNLSAEPFVLEALTRSHFRLVGSALELSFQGPAASVPDTLILHIGRNQQRAARVELVTLSAAERDEFVGDYFSQELGAVYSVLHRDGKLFATHARHPEAELIALGQDRFQGSERWLRNVTFQRDTQGGIAGFEVSTLGVKNMLFRKI